MAACAWCGEEFDAMRHRHACKYCSQECFRLGKSNTLPDGMRRCGQCGEAKPETDEHFYRKRDRRRGRTGWTNDCRPCRAKAKLELARARGRESQETRMGAVARRALVRNEVNALRCLAHKKTRRWVYAMNNEDGVRATRYDPTDKPARFRARYRYDQAFRAYHILKARARDSAMEELSDGTLPPERVARMFGAAKVCGYCGGRMRAEDKHLDHLIPLARGGDHGVENVAVVCARCNKEKHTKTPLEYVLWRLAA